MESVEELDPKAAKGKDNCFRISGANLVHSYSFAASSKKEAQSWVTALIAVIEARKGLGSGAQAAAATPAD